MKFTAEAVWSDILAIRRQSPLIHNITNYVVMNNTANAMLAMGASPVMAHAQEEVSDIVRIANALVINIGTLSDRWVLSMQTAMKEANIKGIPIVLDPVGAGATFYRTQTVQQLLSVASPAVIRGNGSEVMAIVQTGVQTKGVDSLDSSESAIDAAHILSNKYGCAVCVSGKIDYVVMDKQVAQVENGHAMMTRVTGMGCTASALCGVFLSVNPSVFEAAAHAMIVMGIAGELAAERSDGPGSLQLHFLDSLYSLTETAIVQRMKATA